MNEIVPKHRLSGKLVKRLQRSFELALEDPNILDGSDNIALLLARRDDLLLRLTEGDFGPGLWEDLQKTFERFKAARVRASKGSPKGAEQMAEELSNLENLIFQGYHEKVLWQELSNTIEQIRKLTTTEIRRRERAEEVITKSQFKSLLGFVISSVQTRVSNKDERMAVLADLQNLQF